MITKRYRAFVSFSLFFLSLSLSLYPSFSLFEWCNLNKTYQKKKSSLKCCTQFVIKSSLRGSNRGKWWVNVRYEACFISFLLPFSSSLFPPPLSLSHPFLPFSISSSSTSFFSSHFPRTKVTPLLYRDNLACSIKGITFSAPN